MKAFIAIILGSASDRKTLDESGMTKVLDTVGIPWEISYISAHRNPRDLEDYISDHSITTFIAAAGMSAALPGAIASITRAQIPVLGVALPSSEFPDCMDSLLSMVRMPPGMPVQVAGLGKCGFKNAAISAAQICALFDSDVRDALEAYFLASNKPAELNVQSSK